jgi:broad specificity phosphatase PhoE
MIGANPSRRGDHAGATTLLMTHAGVSRAILADVLRLAPEVVFRIDVGYARITVVDGLGDEPVIRCMNAPASKADA